MQKTKLFFFTQHPKPSFPQYATAKIPDIYYKKCQSYVVRYLNSQLNKIQTDIDLLRWDLCHFCCWSTRAREELVDE
jgi:hypothetical protein